jgi:hypothetical protein
MTIYNFKRCINILGVAEMLEKIRNWQPNYKAIAWLVKKPQNNTYFKAIRTLQNLELKMAA